MGSALIPASYKIWIIFLFSIALHFNFFYGMNVTVCQPQLRLDIPPCIYKMVFHSMLLCSCDFSLFLQSQQCMRCCQVLALFHCHPCDLLYLLFHRGFAEESQSSLKERSLHCYGGTIKGSES